MPERHKGTKATANLETAGPGAYIATKPLQLQHINPTEIMPAAALYVNTKEMELNNENRLRQFF